MAIPITSKRQLGGLRVSRLGVATRRSLLVRRARGEAVPRWVIPFGYSIFGIAAGTILPRIEARWFSDLVAPMSVSAAIAIDSSIASGMIALTGIVFALAFVMVQFGAVAYSPRLVSWIARDPILMHAIGVFTATFLYGVAALAWVDRNGNGRVPFLSTMGVVILLLASVGMFVALIQRLSTLQIQRILTSTSERGRHVIDTLYPPLESEPSITSPVELERLPVTQVLIDKGPPRAIQALDWEVLVEAARRVEGVIEVVSAVGDTIGEGMVLLQVHGARRWIDERELMNGFVLGNERTFEQDPKYAINILVEIAIRALSPAVNDPSTAVQTLDHIEDLLVRLGRRRLEIGAYRDAAGDLRLLIPFPAWEDYVSLALEEIRTYGASSVRVMRRIRALLSDLVDVLPAERRRTLRKQQERLESVICRTLEDDEEVLLAGEEDRQGLGAPRTHRGGV